MYKKAIYHEDDNFRLSVELVDDVPFIHLKLYKASKSILDEVSKKWAEVKALAYFDGYEAIYTYTKDERMFKLFNPTRILGEYEYYKEKYKVAEWALN